MGLGVLNKRILMTCFDRGKVGVFDITVLEGEEDRHPKAIAISIKDLIRKGYVERSDEGGLKLYKLTDKGAKKAESLLKQISN